MGDALVLAKNKNFDVFNALDLMENRLNIISFENVTTRNISVSFLRSSSLVLEMETYNIISTTGSAPRWMLRGLVWFFSRTDDAINCDDKRVVVIHVF